MNLIIKAIKGEATTASNSDQVVTESDSEATTTAAEIAEDVGEALGELDDLGGLGF